MYIYILYLDLIYGIIFIHLQGYTNQEYLPLTSTYDIRGMIFQVNGFNPAPDRWPTSELRAGEWPCSDWHD